MGASSLFDLVQGFAGRLIIITFAFRVQFARTGVAFGAGFTAIPVIGDIKKEGHAIAKIDRGLHRLLHCVKRWHHPTGEFIRDTSCKHGELRKGSMKMWTYPDRHRCK